MKKKMIISAAVLVLLILLFPIRSSLKDGGSVRYKALTYEITKVHSLNLQEETEKEEEVKPYKNGIIIEILGCEVYHNVK